MAAEQLEIVGADPVAIRKIQEFAANAAAGVVHHNVDAAKTVDRRVHQPAGRGGVGQVERQDFGMAARLGDLASDGRQRLGRAGCDHDVGACGGQPQRDGATDAAAGAGDDSRLAGKRGSARGVGRHFPAPCRFCLRWCQGYFTGPGSVKLVGWNCRTIARNPLRRSGLSS
jgi:hypothetical protein